MQAELKRARAQARGATSELALAADIDSSKLASSVAELKELSEQHAAATARCDAALEMMGQMEGKFTEASVERDELKVTLSKTQ
eukprot:COSAG05_NODE_21294_length_273_cov_0.568966_1_plen_83_part_10